VTRTEKSCDLRCGFTLVELVLVVTIIGIAVAVVAPRIKRSGGITEIRVGARTTASLVRFARNSAVSRGLRHRLVYDRTERCFRVEVENDPFDAPEEFKEERLPAGVGDGGHSPDIELEITYLDAGNTDEVFQPDTLTFLPDGSTRDVFVYLRGPKNQAYTVAVVGPTGAIMVAEGEIVDVFEEML
jgi:prepilin-type N-terminal cleavage/methylation domain-containing protein